MMCAMLGVAALAVLMVMRDRPSDVGLRPFGDEGTQPLPAPAPNNAPIMAAALGTLRDAAKTRAFWILFATFFICGASTNGLIQVHLIPMCLDFGIPQVQAASLLAAMGIFDFVGTIVSGWLSDRYDNRWLLFWYYGLRGLSADRAAVRAGARQSGVRLDLCRPSIGCWRGGFRRRPDANDLCELPARLLRCRRALHRCGADHTGDLAAGAEAGGGGSSGVKLIVLTRFLYANRRPLRLKTL
jgi:hypothetical protein